MTQNRRTKHFGSCGPINWKSLIKFILILNFSFVYSRTDLCTIDTSVNGYKDTITDIHLNYFRKNIVFHTSATNMLKMQWDEDLAKNAEDHASLCPAEASEEFISPKSGYYVQQCLKEVVFNIKEVNEQQPVNRFLKFLNDWNAKYVDNIDNLENSERNKNCWSYIVSANTWRVGCAIATLTLDKKDNYKDIYICNFAPVISKSDKLFKYGEGKPACSECPKNTRCVDNLCNVDEGKTLVFENVLWSCTFNSKGNSKDCKNEKLCKFGWKLKHEEQDYVKAIKITNNILSSIMFKEPISLKSKSCFKVLYKYISTSTKPGDVKLVLFAMPFDIIEETVTIGKALYSTNWSYLNLEIPWENSRIQVGLGIEATSAVGNEIMIKKLLIYEGPCQRKI